MFKNRLFVPLMFAYAFCAIAPASQADVILGIDRLFDHPPHLALIEGKNVAVVGNHTSVDSEGVHLLDRLSAHATVVAAFGPEHGFEGAQSAGDKVNTQMGDGFPIYSLYGEFRTPSPEMLEDVDVLIYDIQDVGVKFYTYISSLFLSMTAAKREGIPIIVLDRPNPVGAVRVEGEITNPAYLSFVGVIPLPIRYGMTVGELARLFNGESFAGFALNTDLTVVRMRSYERDMPFEETGVAWIAPSPNMPSVETALIYPGTCLFEGTNLSEGRGTEAPFLTLGAPFIIAQDWLDAIPAEVQNGVTLHPIEFTPVSMPGKSENPKHQDERCQGIRIEITDPEAMQPIPLAVAMLCAAQDLYPEQISYRKFMDLLWGNENLRSMLQSGADYKQILATTNDGVEQFETVREQYLLYN